MVLRLVPLLALLPFGLGAAVSTTPSVSVDPFVRSSVRTFHTTVYPASSGVAVNWTGSTASCTVGTQNQDFRNATILRINYYRRLVRLPDIGEDTGASAKCAQAALMMHANGTLNHSPPTTWNCYTAGGAEAAGKSNLAMGSGSSGACIDQYIDDAGTGNTAAGHRRWILFPPLINVGTGDTTSYNALWVIDTSTTNITGPRPATPTYVAWPYAGYFPTNRVPGSTRWSYAVAGANFSNATVSVRDATGAAVTATKETYSGNSYGDNTMVYKVAALTTSPGTVERPYHVHLRGITNTSTRQEVYYTVLLFDVTQTRTDEARPTATVAATAATATEGSTPGVFTVTLSAPAERDTWINYALGGTATSADFTTTGQIKIATGATSATLTINGTTDAIAEATGETVVFTLDPGASYTVGATASATVTVRDPGGANTTPTVATAAAANPNPLVLP